MNLVSQAEEELRGYAGEITLYEDVPSGDEEIIRAHRGCGRSAGKLHIQNQPLCN